MKFTDFELIAIFFPIKFQIYGATLPIFNDIRKIIFINIINLRYVKTYNNLFDKILCDKMRKIEDSLDKQIRTNDYVTITSPII